MKNIGNISSNEYKIESRKYQVKMSMKKLDT